jgi:hypothetical protein
LTVTAGGVQRGLGIGFDEVQDHRVGDEAGLHDFGHARDDFVAWQCFQGREVDKHGSRLVKCADQILARLGVDAGLPTDGGVHHAEQRGRHVHDVHSTQPCCGGESRNVGCGPPAEADDGVLAADADAAQHVPDEHDHGQFLARFGVRDLDPMRVDPLAGEVVTDGLGRLRQHRLVQDRDFVPAVEDAAQLPHQAGADDDGIGRIGLHLNGDGRGGISHAGPLHGGPILPDWRGRWPRTDSVSATPVSGATSDGASCAVWAGHLRRADSPVAKRCNAPPHRDFGGWC